MKRLLIPVTRLLAPAVIMVCVWCVVLYSHHGSLGFRCGLLATVNAPYLDGSSKLFQQCTWHLGNGTRTWGETYGVKAGRLYVGMEVRHTSPHISPADAREDQ